MTVESLTSIGDEYLLMLVKSSLNITGTHFDTTLQLYIDEVKAFLKSGGISADVVNSSLAVGCISRGVADLWNYGNGDTQLSEYFFQRAEQLRHIQVATSSDGTEDGGYITKAEADELHSELAASVGVKDGIVYLLNAESEQIATAELPVDSSIELETIDDFFEE